MRNRCCNRYRSHNRTQHKTQREINRPIRRDKKKPAHKRSLFLISDEKLSFVRGFLLWERHDGRPRRHDSRPHAETRARPMQANMPPAEGTPRRSGANTNTACAAPKPYVQRSGMPSTTAKTVLAPRRSSSPACSGTAASPCTLFSARLAPSTTSVPFEEPRSLTSQPS